MFNYELDKVSDVIPIFDSRSYLSAGEVYWYWYFIQGSIMDPYTRRHLRDSWGFCQRHMAGWLLIESAFRHNFFHGPSILLNDLIDRARNCFSRYQVPFIVALRLRNKKICLGCDLGYDSETKGYASMEMLIRSRDISYLAQFADETELYWRKSVCPRCLGSSEVDGMLCRIHLIQELLQNKYSSFNVLAAFINYLSEQLTLYSRSFRWECRGTETIECKASLISAAGWLSGWNELINLIENKR